MASPRKVDVQDDRPAEEQAAVQDVDTSRLKGPTEAQQDRVGIAGNHYRIEQLKENAAVLLGVPTWVFTVALGDDDSEDMTLARARQLVQKFSERQISEES